MNVSYLGGLNCLTYFSYLQNVCSGNKVASVTVVERVQSVNGLNILLTTVSGMKELMHVTENDENHKIEFDLKFLLQQIQLLFATQRIYSPTACYWQSQIFCSSRSTYFFLSIYFYTFIFNCAYKNSSVQRLKTNSNEQLMGNLGWKKLS